MTNHGLGLRIGMYMGGPSGRMEQQQTITPPIAGDIGEAERAGSTFGRKDGERMRILGGYFGGGENYSNAQIIARMGERGYKLTLAEVASARELFE